MNYTLVNQLQTIDNPVSMSQFCELWGIRQFSWNTQQGRYLCVGESSGEWLEDQEMEQFTNPTLDVTLSPHDIRNYCHKWGISNFAWMKSSGHYSCVGHAYGAWQPNVNESTYQLPPGVIIDSPETAQDYCEQWGFDYFAYLPSSQSFTCLGAPKKMWVPNQMSVQYTAINHQLMSPHDAQAFCQQYGFSKFAYSPQNHLYNCYGPNTYNWHPDGVCYNGINLYPTLAEAKSHCMRDGFSYVADGGYRCCT